MREEKTTNRILLLSNMRDYPSQDYFEAVLTEASKDQSLLKTVWKAIKALLPTVTAKIKAISIPCMCLALKEMKTMKKEATLALAEVISELKGGGAIIDEANLAFPANIRK